MNDARYAHMTLPAALMTALPAMTGHWVIAAVQRQSHLSLQEDAQ